MRAISFREAPLGHKLAFVSLLVAIPLWGYVAVALGYVGTAFSTGPARADRALAILIGLAVVVGVVPLAVYYRSGRRVGYAWGAFLGAAALFGIACIGVIHYA